MSSTLNYIRLVYMLVFYFSFSNLFAIDYFRHKYIIKQTYNSLENTKLDLQTCLESKSNNFKDSPPEERIVLSYLNTLLDKIILDNKQILDRFGRSTSKFCIDLENKGSLFSSLGEGLIQVNLDKLYRFFKYSRYGIYDSYIVSSLSHEIAHDLLDHVLKKLSIRLQIYDNSNLKNKYASINEYDIDEKLLLSNDELDFLVTTSESRKNYFEKQMIQYERISQNRKKLEEEYEEWAHFYKTHPDYIKYKQIAEINADDLGLLLYINTGFKAEDFAKSYISSKYRYNDLQRYPSIPDIFRLISQGDNYIIEGKKAIKEKRFDEFMENIKYITPDDIHPSDFWRYWNAIVQIDLFQKNQSISLDSNISNGLYIRIDLSKSEQLDKIKEFFSNQDNRNLLVSNKNDPRVYIIETLLTSFSYTLEFFQNYPDDIGVLQNDNTILMRANDIFQIVLVKEKEFNPFKNISCPSLFLVPEDNQYNLVYYSYIRKAFLLTY